MKMAGNYCFVGVFLLWKQWCHQKMSLREPSSIWNTGWEEEQNPGAGKLKTGVLGPSSKNMQAYIYNSGRKIEINTKCSGLINSLDSSL